MSKRLIAFDIDGTVFYTGLPLSERLVSAFKKRHEVGDIITVSTGRCGPIIPALSGGLLNKNNRHQPRAAEENAPPPVFGQAPSAGTMFAYIDWESVGVYGLVADGAADAECRAVFDAFVSSLLIDPLHTRPDGADGSGLVPAPSKGSAAAVRCLSAGASGSGGLL